jgi:hypothetical protein
MIDWQKYDSGDLSEEERMAADQELKSNPKAREELEGLRKFQRTLRSAGMKEAIPTVSLEAKLSAIARPTPLVSPYAWRWLAPAVAACGIALGWVLANYDFNFGPYRNIESLQAQTTVAIREIDFAGIGHLEKIEPHPSSVTYRFKSQGQQMTFIISPRTDDLGKGQLVTLDGRDFLDTGDFCWGCPTSNYRLAGGTPEMRRQIGARLSRQTGNRKITS